MDVEWEGWINEEFHGYLKGRVYLLSDGSRWRQEDSHAESVFRERPRVKLLWDQSLGRYSLDIEGTSNIVWVVKAHGLDRFNFGAF